MQQAALIEKLQDKSAVIGVIGLGYVGLPLSLRFTEAGYKVIGFDIDEEKVSQLNSGKSYFQHYGDELVSTAVKNGFETAMNSTHKSSCPYVNYQRFCDSSTIAFEAKSVGSDQVLCISYT